MVTGLMNEELNSNKLDILCKSATGYQTVVKSLQVRKIMDTHFSSQG